ncbi:MAG: hypothetical protein H7Y15_00800 [Pseudonocardia sp.]|nr:hypothetical protein [Pseudonocardia sp.]
MRAEFMGKDPDSKVDGSPAPYRTNRTDRITFLVQGWEVTDPEALGDVGAVPRGENLTEVPIEVLRLAAQHEGWVEP